MENYVLVPENLDAERKKLNDILLDAGFHPWYRGYKYLIDACLFSIIDRKKLEGNICKVLYQEIATKYDTKVSCVERCIRHCIEVWWKVSPSNSVKDNLKKMSSKDHPTNKQVIAYLIRYYC